jgi:hypothetical protein
MQRDQAKKSTNIQWFKKNKACRNLATKEMNWQGVDNY